MRLRLIQPERDHRVHRPAFVFSGLVLIGAVFSALGAVGQPAVLEETLLPSSDDSAGDEAPEISLEDQIATLEAELDRAQDERVAAAASESAGTPLQLGATPEEITERTRRYRNLVSVYDSHIDLCRKLIEARQSKQDLDAEEQAWDGFPEGTAFSIDVVDNLRHSVRSLEQQLGTEELDLSLLEQERDQNQTELKEAEQEARQIAERDETADRGEEALQVRWLRDQARLRFRLAEASVASDQTERALLEESRSLHAQELTFLQAKFDVVMKQSSLPLEQLVANVQDKLDILAKLRESLKEERKTAVGKEEKKRDELGLERQNLADHLAVPAADVADPDAQEIKTARLRALIETLQAEQETIGASVSGLNQLIEYTRVEERTWQSRAEVWGALSARGPEDFELVAEARAYCDNELTKIVRTAERLESDLNLALSLETAQRQRLDAWSQEDGDKRLAGRTLAAYQQRVLMCQRRRTGMGQLKRLLELWRDEIDEGLLDVSAWERAWVSVLTAKTWVTAVWGRELFQAGERSITVSKVILALVILVLGFLASRRIATRVRRVTVNRLGIEEDVAAPIETLVYYFLLVVVLLFALNTVRIPLTIFAFLGGAIAIGVGFGAQNLINNFISGIIMLLERPIKIGDIIEVDGVEGRVRHMGSRCSQIRRFDGIDMLVPNSSLLEKNVTNWTLSDRAVRFEVSIGVAYGSPTGEVERLIRQAVNGQPRVLETPEPIILFEEFGDNALIFTVLFWVEVMRIMDARIAASGIRYRVDELFREAGITIAFPQRDVHLDAERPIRVELGGQTGPPKPDSAE